MIFEYPDPAGAGPGVPQLQVEVVGDRWAVTVRAQGEIDLATAELLDAGIDLGLRSAPSRLVVRLSQVTFFSAAGLRVLMRARSEAAEHDIDLVLQAPSASVLMVLNLVRCGDLFRVEQLSPLDASPGETRYGSDPGTRIIE